ncbi:MAG: PAS domain S-box protein [Acidimicrobiia bacterium]|nr:PAS domain S-box protein [Acidimicrobiia bacterium]
MADRYRGSLRAEFAVVTNSAGAWIASPGWSPGSGTPGPLAGSIGRAHDGQPGRGIVMHDGRLYLTVTEPALFADEVLGTLTAGYRLDDNVARELALASRCEVTLLVEGRPSGSSLPPGAQQALLDMLDRDGDALGRLRDPADLRSLGQTSYISGTYPVTRDDSNGTAGRLVLLQDWAPTQAFIDQVQVRILQAGGTMFVLALAAGLVVSRRLTGPLREMAAVTRDVAAGRWDRRVPVDGQDETALLAAAFNDMTTSLSHWHAEAQSKTAELLDAYERFHAVAETAQDAIISTDNGGRIHFWNLSAGRTFGREAPDAAGRSILDLLDEPSREQYRDLTTRLRAGDTAPGIRELTALRSDGTTFPVEVSLATWQSGEERNFTAIVRDITARRQAEDALRLREQELRQAQKMEAVGRLAGGVAHDFNNLLTAIRGYAELLVYDLPEGDPKKEDAAEIVKAADSAGSLTRQLLAFSRKQILAPQIVSIETIVRGMQKMLTRLIGEDIALSVTSEGQLARVKADPGQIEQVILNLAVNARDAMPTGGELAIRLANVTEEGAARVLLEVRDTGMGMDAETISHIFEPFYTTKEAGAGTGLGLATVLGIVEQSGGTITVDSEPGRGTCFRILFPQAAAAPAVTASDVPRAEGGASETVLLVEDEASVRRFAHQVLTREGYHVLEAANGHDALDLAGRHDGPIHLLVTDVVMPGKGGRVVWEELAVARPELKVLFVSGYTEDAVVRHGIREMGLPYLQKPFSVTALADAVRSALTSRRSRLEH